MQPEAGYKALLASLLILLEGWAVLFWGHFPGLISRWSTEDLSYSFIIPFLAAYLGFKAIQDQGREPYGGLCWPGILVLILAGFLYLAARVGSLETFVYGAMWLSLVGIVLTVLGISSLRPLGFPLLLLAFAIPPPPFIVSLLSFRLRLISSQLSMPVFHGLNIPAFREGNVIDLGLNQLQVVEACSGLRYFFPILIIGLVVGHLFRLGLGKQLLVLAACLPLVVGTNTVRIVSMGLGARQEMSWLLEGLVHDTLGLILFVLSIGLLWGLARLLKPRQKGDAGPGSEQQPGTEGWSRRALAGYTSAALVVLVLTWSAPSYLIASSTAPARQSFADFPSKIGAWKGEFSRLSPGIEDSLWADDYVSGVFRHLGKDSSLHLLIPYYSYQTVRHTAHAPTSCLLGSGFDLLHKTKLQPNPEAGRDFPVRQMVLARHDGRELSNFWFEQRGRIITNEYMNKLFLIWDGLSRQRTDGALVRVEMVLGPEQSVAEAQAVLDPFLGRLRQILSTGFVPG